MEQPKLLSLEATAQQLGGVSTRTVRRMIDDGQLDSVKVMARLTVPMASIADWIEANTRTCTKTPNNVIKIDRNHQTPNQATSELDRMLQ